MNEPTNASIPQPLPVHGQKYVLEFVVNDLRERAESGRVKYGTYLMTHNGRDPLWDAYQEALDLTMYLRQHLLEREGRVKLQSNHDAPPPPEPPTPPKPQLIGIGDGGAVSPEAWLGVAVIVLVFIVGFLCGTAVMGLGQVG